MLTTNDWLLSEARRTDIARATERHQLAQQMQVRNQNTARAAVGQWMIKMGQQLLENEPTAEVMTSYRA